MMRDVLLRFLKRAFRTSPALHDLCTDASSELYYEDLERRHPVGGETSSVDWVDGPEPDE